MDFKFGNQLWKLRQKDGRDKIFKTPQELYDAACDYFKWCDENPIIEHQVFHDRGVLTDASIKHQRPYTITGLITFLGVSDSYWRVLKHTCTEKIKENPNHVDGEFLTILSRIETIMYEQKFSGATVGVFNGNIIARDLGLIDKTENDTNLKGEIKIGIINIDPLSDEGD